MSQVRFNPKMLGLWGLLLDVNEEVVVVVVVVVVVGGGGGGGGDC